MKLLLLLLRSLLLTIFIVLLTTCNASESDTNIPKNSESVQIPEDEKAVQIPEDENWKIFEDNRSGITFSYPSIWKTIDGENMIVLEGPFGHIVFQDISVPADELDQVAKDFLIDKGYNPDFGARPLRRALGSFIEDPLAESLLAGDYTSGDHIKMTYKEGDDHLFFSVTHAEKTEEPKPETSGTNG